MHAKPGKKYQIPVMFRMLFNCGLRTSELLNLRVCDVDFTEKVLAIRDTKFHKSRLVPFTDAVAIPLANYLELFPPASNEAILLPVAVLAVKENSMEPLGYTHNSGHF